MNTLLLNVLSPVVHIVASLITPIWFYVFTETAVDWRVLISCMVLSLLPDIDTQTSLFGRALPFIAEPLERRFGHRQITHSFLALTIVGVILWLAFPTDWLLLLSGYGSHLVIDTLTGTQGIPLLWPSQLRFYLLRIRPKSTAELILGLCCLFLTIAPYFSATHQIVAGLTPAEESLTLRPTLQPTPTPATFSIRVSNVYDIDTEILIAPGDTLIPGQKIAILHTHRLLHATATPKPTQTNTPTITPSPLHLVTLSPFPTPDPLYIAELDNNRSLAHARYLRAIATGTPDPNKRAAVPSYHIAIAEKRACMENNAPKSWQYWTCKTELEALEATAVSLLATSPSIDPLDANIAYHQWQAAEIHYQQALAALTPPPTMPPTPTPTPSSSPTATLTPTPITPTSTTLPVADEYTVYSQIAGEVAAVNLHAINGNSITVEIIILINPTDPLFHNPLIPSPARFSLLPSAHIPAIVHRVIDGDTIIVQLQNGVEETVRLLGIDTPEIVHPDRPPECYGQEASDFVKSQLPPETAVFLELDSQTGERDVYGRLLAHLWQNDELFNAMLLEEGYGRFQNFGNPTIYDEVYVGMEETAVENELGLWAACE